MSGSKRVGALGWATAFFALSGACFLAVKGDPHPSRLVALTGLCCFIAGVFAVVGGSADWRRPSSGGKNDTHDASVMGGGQFH